MKNIELENNFIKNYKITTILVLTEIQSLYMKTECKNMKKYMKLRNKRSKKGGGVMVMHKETEDIELEEKVTRHNDLLIVEGTIKGKKAKIITSYFDSNKSSKGKEYNSNRKLQEEIEKEMEVPDGTMLFIMGDHNGRTTLLEPQLKVGHQWRNGRKMDRRTQQNTTERG